MSPAAEITLLEAMRETAWAAYQSAETDAQVIASADGYLAARAALEAKRRQLFGKVSARR